MRRLGAICLCLGLAAPALAADPPPAEEPSVPWYRWLFLGERAKPAAARPQAASRDKPPAARPAQSPREAAARTLAEEQRVYLERLGAITKIRQVAFDQRDDELLKRADELEAKAEEIFKQRTALLPGAGDGRDDRALLERGRDDRPATAERPAPRRRPARGDDR
jgi:pyruvate/2-oxoglutarate dehydrogenase complex dihydrolipoamide acyltransferase (E2) component